MTEGHTDRLEAALDGKYRIERKLGEGGMASVYLAEDIKHKRKVALKILVGGGGVGLQDGFCSAPARKGAGPGH